MAYSELEAVSGFVGNYQVQIRHKSRFIEDLKCTGCGQCADACPIDIPNEFDMELNSRKASYRNFAQAIPNIYTIEKKGVAPCRDACPTDQRAMGYIALIRKKRYADAYWAIRREHPFPSVCGRVCNRQCEDACSRGLYDEPVNIMGLKRFIADWAYEHRNELPDLRDKSMIGTPYKKNPQVTEKKVAIIGAGPAGLTAGHDLVRLGHDITIFDSLPFAGGMMSVGIPPHRLPRDCLNWEIQQILDEGVKLILNTWIDDIPGLLQNNYLGGPFDSVLIATGAHRAQKLPIRNSNHPANWLSLEFLRRITLGENINLKSQKIAVLGGGNVALDAARTAIRLGTPEVRVICLEQRGEMPGFHWEIKVAEDEGIKFFPSRKFEEIVTVNEKVVGVRCVKIRFHGFRSGRPIFDEIPGTEHVIPADIIIWAIGQGPDFSFLPQDGSVCTHYPIGVLTNEDMMTTIPGVFAAGDVRRGKTFFVVDAINEGHHAARCIDRYLRGESGIQEKSHGKVAYLSNDEVFNKIRDTNIADWGRTAIKCIPPEERANNFREVDLTLTEAEAHREALRCIQCGVCSECLECVAACDRGAVNHDLEDSVEELTVGTIILASGFRDFNPAFTPKYGYRTFSNIITAMEFERMINPSGPTYGKVLLENGKKPERVAIIHCVGSRDNQTNNYCSRACCMYSIKFAQLVREYLGAEVFEIYRDMRTFGKDYEEFYNRTKKKGVNFYHGEISEILSKNEKIQVRWTKNYYNQPDNVTVDMVILATGFEPQHDSQKVASLLGIPRGPDGFFLEKHPKLGPIETTMDGIFVAGACQSPKDIPDSIIQAGGAAAAALALIDQGSIALDPTIADVDQNLCASCGNCSESCPYGAIHQENGFYTVDEFGCKGCGTCVASCPSKAISLFHYQDQQLIDEIIGALAVV